MFFLSKNNFLEVNDINQIIFKALSKLVTQHLMYYGFQQNELKSSPRVLNFLYIKNYLLKWQYQIFYIIDKLIIVPNTFHIFFPNKGIFNGSIKSIFWFQSYIEMN